MSYLCPKCEAIVFAADGKGCPLCGYGKPTSQNASTSRDFPWQDGKGKKHVKLPKKPKEPKHEQAGRSD